MTATLAFHVPFFEQAIVLVILALFLAACAFWIWMLVDVLSGTLPPTEKLIWVLVILFLHAVGALIYLVVGRQPSGGRMTGGSDR